MNMWKIAIVFGICALSAACTTSGPINTLSARTREDVAKLNTAYQSFSKNSSDVSAARIDADATYRERLARSQTEDDFDDLVSKLAEHPSLRLKDDMRTAQANLTSYYLAPPTSAAFAEESAKALLKVSAPSEQLTAVGANLAQLERRRSTFDALLAIARFAGETAKLIETKLEEGRAYRADLLKAAQEKAMPTSN